MFLARALVLIGITLLCSPALATQPCDGHVDPPVVNLAMQPGESVSLQKCICLDPIPPLVDIVFAVDLTGSMGGEAANLKSSIVNIINTVRAAAPSSDIRFGLVTFEDYPAAYNFCGYNQTFGSGAAGDEPFRVDAPIGASDAAVQAAINAMTIKDGSDGPESYARVIWEAAQADSGIDFRDGALRLVLIFGDSIPHDCGIKAGLPSNIANQIPFTSTGRDPGRDELVNTADDIDFHDQAFTAALAANVRPVMVFSGPATGFFQAWEYWAAQMNGFARRINTDGTVPGGTLPNLILQILRDASSTVKELKLVPEPGCPLVITTIPPKLGPISVSNGATACLTETIMVPLDIDPQLSPIQCFVDVLADGVLIAQQEVNVVLNVPPVCDAGGPYAGQCNGGIVMIPLDGTGSDDPDGGNLTYLWTTNCANATITNPTSANATLNVNTAGGACNVNCTVTLTINDGTSAPVACNAGVTINDPVKPVVSGCAVTGGPVDASGQRVVTFQGTVTDNCCVTAAGVSVVIQKTAGTAFVGSPTINKTQVDGKTVAVSGSVLVSQVTACPVTIQMTINATDCCGNAATACTASGNVSDGSAPVLTLSAVGGSVDGQCKKVVTFGGSVEDNTCVVAADVSVDVQLLSANATLGTPVLNIVQQDGNTVSVSGSVLVSALTDCPAIVQITLDALDCCDNAATAPRVETVEVTDDTPPIFTVCPPDQQFTSSCDPNAIAWLASVMATDNCAQNLSIVPSITDCTQLVAGQSTEVTWTTEDFCGNSAECSATATIELGGRAHTNKSGSLLFYSKIELRWDNAGNLLQDTFLELTNDGTADVIVQMYFINGDPPLGANTQTGERAHPGWNKLPFRMTLTDQEPTYWSANTGGPRGVPSFTALDAGFPPGRPDPEDPTGQQRLLRGYAVIWAVGADGNEVRWNYLAGSGMLLNFAETSAWEYGAWGYQAVGVGDGQPLGTPGVLRLDGSEYDHSPGRLLMDFFAPGLAPYTRPWLPIPGPGKRPLDRSPRDPGIPTTVEMDLTLFPVSVDLRQDTMGPVATFALMDIYDENENQLSGTGRCVTCWDQTLLRNYDVPNNFLPGFFQTTKGKARIDGVVSTRCPNSINAAILGVAAKRLKIENEIEWAGLALTGQDRESAIIRYDP